MRFNRRKRNLVAFKVICAFWALAVAVWNAHPAQAAPFAYVGNDDSSVSVIDTAINEIVAKVPTAAPARSLAVSTDGKRVYVIGGGTISVLGTSTNTVVSTTVEHVNLDRVAVAPDGKRAYVTGSRFDSTGPPSPANLVILVFDTATKTVVGSKQVDHVGKAGGIAITRNGKQVYIGCDDKIIVLDTDSNNVTTVSVPNARLSGVAITPDGKRVYVSDSSGDKVSVLDTASNRIMAAVSFAFPVRQLSGVAITPDGKHAYVLGSSTVSVLDTTDNRVVATISLLQAQVSLSGIAITPDGKYAYVAGGSVWAIDTTTNTVVDMLTVPKPNDVATMPPPESATTVNIASCGVSVFAQGFIGDFPQQGAATGQMRQFLGIPYAAAPVGANRWNPPQRFCWDGTRQFTAFGNHCASPPSIFGGLNFNEDCLFLNIFTPVNVDVNHPVPVMVWIHGGEFQVGESEQYNPVSLVDAGVIVVTINYRLGALGFLAHPKLDNKATGNTGNYGIQDQQEALRWVRQNISAFAGDAEKVTIFGQSAGGISVLYHLASPGSKRLFSRAIIQSGASAIRKQPTLSEAETLGKNFADAVGCGNVPDPDVAACLRALNVLTILANQNVLSQPSILGPSANVDEVVLKQSVLEVLQTPNSPNFNGVPIIHGSNHDEGRFFIPLTPQLGTLHADGGFTDNLVPGQDTFPGAMSYTNALKLLFTGSPPDVVANVVAKVVEKYPGGSTDASANAALAAVATDLNIACPAVAVDTLAALQGVAVYAYEFNDASAPPNYFGPITMHDGNKFPFAAAHTAEIQYIFPISNPSPVGFQLRQIPMNPAQLEIAATMVNYWTKFAATGNPNPGSSDQWPSFPAASATGPAATPQWRSFGTEHKLTNTFARDHNCAFWRDLGG